MYIEGRKIKNFADIQKNFQYEVVFRNAASLVPGWTEEDVTLRARSFSIPQRGHEAIEDNFGAMKQFFSGKPTFSNTTEIMFQETHSQAVQRFLDAWQQRMFDVNSGHSNFARKRDVCDTIIIKAFDNENKELDNKYYFINAWLQNVADVSIDYSQAGEGVKFTATFQFDFFTFGSSEPIFNPGAALIPAVPGAVVKSNVGTNPSIKE